jgi:serine beta-lactamase-like protein LACTB
VYERAVAKLQRPAAEALARAHRRLAEHGVGIQVFDAYRPWWVTKVFWDAAPRHLKLFVADPMRGSRHNRGCAVDVTLYDLGTGAPIEMPSGYDEFTARAYPDYPGGTSRQRYFRELLRRAMEDEGFDVYEHEWWHFDHREWRRFAIGNEPL